MYSLQDLISQYQPGKPILFNYIWRTSSHRENMFFCDNCNTDVFFIKTPINKETNYPIIQCYRCNFAYHGYVENKIIKKIIIQL
jgi:hypothetical protein